jgi:hypothetical protein
MTLALGLGLGLGLSVVLLGALGVYWKVTYRANKQREGHSGASDHPTGEPTPMTTSASAEMAYQFP